MPIFFEKSYDHLCELTLKEKDNNGEEIVGLNIYGL